MGTRRNRAARRAKTRNMRQILIQQEREDREAIEALNRAWQHMIYEEADLLDSEISYRYQRRD